jgi:chromosome segregation ATPase
MAIAELQTTIRELRAKLIEATDDAEGKQAALSATEGLSRERKQESEQLLRELHSLRTRLTERKASLRERELERQRALEHVAAVQSELHDLQREQAEGMARLCKAVESVRPCPEYLRLFETLGFLTDASSIIP